MRQQVKLARLLNRVRLAAGASVPVRELADAIWGDDPEGGPLDPGNTLRQMAWQLRQMGYPVWAESPGYWHGYRFVPQFKEISDMTENHGRVITRGKKKLATDYLPAIESVRLKRTIERTEAQRNTAMSALAICEGQLAAKDFEIDALKRVIAELNEQREANWAKPDNVVVDPAHPPIHVGPLKSGVPAS